MPFKDSLIRGLKAFAHSVKVFSVNVSIMMALNSKRNEMKRVLLSRFKVRQLNEIAERYGISLKGAKVKSKKISILAEHLSFEQVVRLAKRYKIKYKDVLEELDRYKAQLESKKTIVKTESKIEELIKALKEFKPEPVRDEEELEKQLYQYLKARLPKIPIKRQAKIGRYRADIQVGPCCIELKIPRSSTQLQRLIGQVRDYTEHVKCVITVILDVGITRDLGKYTRRLEEMGIIPIVIEGKLKR